MSNPHRDRNRRQQRGFRNDGLQDQFQRHGYLDVSIAEQTDRRPPPRRDNRGGGGDNRQDRPRLVFNEVHQVERGYIIGKVTMAEGQHGRIWNFSVERQNRDRTSRFFRDTDTEDLRGVIAEIQDWIAKRKAEAV